jgi:GNAT superfamily N-acetyltransferase
MERPMTADIEIRHLELEEIDALVAAQTEIFSDYIIPMRSSREFFMDFTRSVGGKPRNILIALSGKDIIGYVNPVIDGEEAWIGGVGVVPSHRRKGVGRRLMVAAEDFARDNGVEEIILEVIRGNDVAHRLYVSMGYEEHATYLTAEGKPTHFAGFEVEPKKAALPDLLSIHERAYADACWQKRKVSALVHGIRSAEQYRVEGGFVVLRKADTNGFIPFLGVVPEKRGRGIGTSLAKFAFNRLWELGLFKVAVYNINENPENLRMLDKFDLGVTIKQVEMRKSLV